METNNNDAESNAIQKNNRIRMFKINGAILLLAFPVMYLFIKSSGTPQPAAEQAVSNQVSKTDISQLEANVNANPNVDNLNDLAMAYINNKMPLKSIGYLQRAIAIDPKNAVVYNNMAVAYIMMQQYKNGIDACTKALNIDNKMQLAKNNLKWALDEQNKVDALLKKMEETPKDKRTIAFYNDWGMMYYNSGNYDKSIEIWSNIGDIDKNNTDALNNIGTAFMMKYQFDDALALFNRAVELEPTNQLAKNNVMWAKNEKNKVASSIKK